MADPLIKTSVKTYGTVHDTVVVSWTTSAIVEGANKQKPIGCMVCYDAFVLADAVQGTG